MNDWHELTINETAAELGTDLGYGLSSSEVISRTAKYGKNEIMEKRRRSLLSMMFSQLTEFIILVLIAAALVSMFLGEMKDAVVILAIVVLNAIFGVAQEERAGRAISALKKLTVPMVMIKRDGEICRASIQELVPGDIIFLEAGASVGADARLIESVNLRMNESSLTGESAPVDKSIDPIKKDSLPVADMNNMVFMGTTVTYGRGEAIVTATGMSTQIGRIAEMVQEDVEVSTPLQVRLKAFGKWLGLAALFICFLVFIAAAIEGAPIFDAFLTAVSLAVAAIPEGLPAVTTISLALGAYRMSKRGAIIRKLPAVETLGSVSVICSDKTGTLTQNKMTANTIYINGKRIMVSGRGYDPVGTFEENEAAIQPLSDERLKELLNGVTLCNDSHLERFKETGGYDVIGDPTEGALIVLAAKAGVTREELEKTFPRIAEIPFDSKRKLMTTAHITAPGEYIIYVKGAPDILIGLCKDVNKQQLISENEELASKGLRNLAVAYKKGKGDPDMEHAEEGLNFLGIVGMIDLPRQEVLAAVELCKEAGITPIMITGDHVLTAKAVAKELGIEKVYARISPEQKLEIVDELKKKGEIVAVTGDGINDAPALNHADIGIAMGITGTDVAKEASDMVLADDNFATIVEAVREGRGIFENIRKFVWYLLSANVGEILTMFIAIMMRLPLPLLPIQILWVNLVTDGLPALALSAEPIEEDVMKAPPRKKEEGIINGNIIFSMISIGLIIGAVCVFVFIMGMRDSLAKGRTLAFSAMALLEMYHVFNCKSEKKSVFSVGIFSNMYLIFAVALTVLLQLAVIYNPIMQRIFNTVALSGTELIYLFTLSSIPLFFMEGRKLLGNISRK